MKVRRFLAVLIAVVLVPAVQAAQNPTSARGFNADGVYQMGTIDSINTFSGSLNLSLPLGSPYLAGDRLRYSFTLSYNSSFWDLEERIGSDNHRFYEGVPNRRANAGIGFTLTLGDLFYHDDPVGLVYVAPDGSEHAFLDRTIHFDNEPVIADVWYSRDGEYLRLRKTAPTQYTVDLPDGTSKDFECMAGTPCGPFVKNQTRFRLKRIYDAFGNQLTIEQGTEPTGNTWDWTIQEQTEGGYTTTHRLTFQRYSLEPYRWIVQKLDLEVSGASVGAGSGRRAVYWFDYYDQNGLASRLYRPKGHNATGSLIQVQPPSANADWLVVPMLKSVTLPDDSKWQFTYQNVTPPGPQTSVVDGDNSMIGITYPTGGGIHYEWGAYTYARRRCRNLSDPDPAPMPRPGNATGVTQRQLLKEDGTSDGEPWRYIQGSVPLERTPEPNIEWCEGWDGSFTTIVDPLGNVTINYFSTVIRESDGGYGHPRDYGLPFEPSYHDPLDSSRNLSTRVYRCTSTAPFAPPLSANDIYGNAFSPPAPACTKLRETYVRYDWSGLRCDWSVEEDSGPRCTSSNRRVQSQRTVFNDDGNAWTLVENDDFDGFGHYRRTKTSGNFFAKNDADVFSKDALTGSLPHGDVKISYTKYNPSVTFSLNPPQFLNAPGVIDRWILNLYTETSLEEPAGPGEPAVTGGIVKSEYFFDSRGFLQQKRTLAGASRSTKDLLTTYQRVVEDSSTVRIDERYYGGDQVPISTAALPIDDPGSAQYALRHIHRFGTLQKSSYVNCTGSSTILLLQENEVDPFTGLVLSSADSTGAKTKYTYDVMNRTTQIEPPGEATTSFVYSKASLGFPFGPASVLSTRDDPDSSDDPQTRWFYDHLGRLARVEQRLPGSNRWSRATTTYHPTGWVRSQSTTRLATDNEDPADVSKTEFPFYDPFGRVLLKKHADSSSYTTTYDYRGSRVATTTIQGTATSVGSATTKTYSDTQGRLAAVVERLGTDNRTVYEYDSSNRLVKVRAGGIQTPLRNQFTFDNRGFLLKELHPELGPNSPGISYGGYDARGNVHEVYYGNLNNRHELDRSIAYDGAERLLTVKQPGRPDPDNNNQPSLLKSLTYYQESDNTPYQLGRLKSAVRENHVYQQSDTSVPRTISITEIYRYDSTTRRVKERVLVSAGLKMKTSFRYDKLGNPTSTTYPLMTTGCNVSSTCIAAGADRVVQNKYQFGFLTEVPGFVQGITYHPNGMVEKVRHANGVDWIQEMAANNIARPNRIRVEKGATKLWNSGFYKYDAAGDISQIDSDRFTYDEVGRLVKADMPASGSPEIYSYDRFGNHKPFPDSDVLPDSSTNRLPSGVASYDAAGNVTTFTHPRQNNVQYRYEYDPFNLMRHMTAWRGSSQVLGRMFLYDAFDERVAVIDYIGAAPLVRETWSVRDAGNRVIRDMQRSYNPDQPPASTRNAPLLGWSWVRDYVFRGSTVVASVAPTESGSGEVITHIHPDHLGTPRQTSNAAGSANAERVRVLRPFGEEKVPLPDSIRLKFTGHERDAAGGDLRYGDLDYMHARYYNPLLGRFLSIDPGRDIDALNPQSWNLYAYVRNSPVGATDPTGRTTKAREKYTGTSPAERCEGSSGTSNNCIAQEKARREAEARQWEADAKAAEYRDAQNKQFWSDVETVGKFVLTSEASATVSAIAGSAPTSVIVSASAGATTGEVNDVINGGKRTAGQRIANVVVGTVTGSAAGQVAGPLKGKGGEVGNWIAGVTGGVARNLGIQSDVAKNLGAAIDDAIGALGRGLRALAPQPQPPQPSSVPLTWIDRHR